MLTSLVLAASAAIISPSASATTASPVPVSEVSDPSSAVSFKTKDKLILKGSYYAPKKSKSKSKAAPAALLIHDAGSDRSELESVAGYLKRGFAVLVVDLRDTARAPRRTALSRRPARRTARPCGQAPGTSTLPPSSSWTRRACIHEPLADRLRGRRPGAVRRRLLTTTSAPSSS